jgi:aryl-alcohol dehydrogenase-like predicted oxidoreductase
MRYRKLGRSGLLVSELCLGTNMFGGAGLEFWKDLGGLDQTSVNAVIARAIEGGVNFIDTADGYAEGQAEMSVGQALKELQIDRSGVVICTKAGMQMGPGPNGSGTSRAHLIHACENSLERLGTDYIDLYLLHVLDPVTPLEETLRALEGLVSAGKVRYVGCSNFAAWEIMKALGISERERLARFEVVQSNWSIATRDVEREIVPMARSESVGIMAWGALLGGVLSGKYRRDRTSDQPGRHGGRISPLLDANKVHDIVDALRDVAQAHEVTPAEIALAFLLRERAATSIIFGATKPEQVAANLRASGLVLSQEEFERLDKVSALTPDHGAAVIARGRVSRQQYLPS